MNRAKLKQLMRDNEMTDADLARELKCAQSTVHHWHSGQYEPRSSHIKRICELLDCSSDDLLGVDIKKTDRLTRAKATGLLEAITEKGKYNSQAFHLLATKFRKMAGGKITPIEILFRNIAETLYDIEIITKQPLRPESEVEQLRFLE